MFKEPDADSFRTHTQNDLLALATKTTVGVVGALTGYGLVGGVMGDFLTQFIPAQRIDRLHDYLSSLDDRLTGVEEQFQSRVREGAAYTVLVERATIAAVQQASPVRRRDIASLVKTGLDRTDAELEEHVMLLRLLERLNDSEVLLLMFYQFPQTFGSSEMADFMKRHPHLFPELSDDSGSEEWRRREVMKNAYVGELVSMGLLEDTEGTIKSSPTRRVALTPLGGLLLEAIERQQDIA